MPEKITQDCTLFPALPRYLEWFKLFYSIYGFINGTVIYTHVCMYVCMYIGMYLKFCLPQLTFPQTNVAIFSSREQCTSREEDRKSVV